MVVAPRRASSARKSNSVGLIIARGPTPMVASSHTKSSLTLLSVCDDVGNVFA